MIFKFDAHEFWLAFYAPGLKDPPGASSNQIVRPFVNLSRLHKSAIIKVLVVIQLPNLDCKFI